MPEFNITEFDIVFLSYDEPNAEKHWADLLDKAPWAKRVNGVKGFDAAHRACAETADTDWFVTVDADNIVRPEFFDTTVTFDPKTEPRRCFSWNGLNAINGLSYGNGGLKLWSKEFVLTMNSHENADDPRKAVDFCWEDDYRQLYRTYSDVWTNGSAYQAFRVGFREGVKLSLNRGERINPEMMQSILHPVNLRNLKVWCSVGAHIPNGLWAIYGTRAGLLQMCDLSWDHTIVRDYDWFLDFWGNTQSQTTDLSYETKLVGNTIKLLTKMDIPLLGETESAFFRDIMAHKNE